MWYDSNGKGYKKGYNMRGEISLKILQGLSQATMGAADLIKAILVSGYGASAGKIQNNLRKIESRHLQNELAQLERQKYHNIIYWLKTDGLIESRHNGLGLTAKGKKRLVKLLKRKQTALPAKRYSEESEKKITIVAFDIPERERRKRDWLRGALRNIGLQMIQKSLWLGKKKIPRDFLEDLRKLGMLEWIEIFEISQFGTLRHLT